MGGFTNSLNRRLNDPSFSRYFAGAGIDVGGGGDSLANMIEKFPNVTSCKNWDFQDGDATFMANAADNTYDFLTSNHCLEHLVDVKTGLKNWLRIVKSKGYLVITVPDEDLYEQGKWPSRYNYDHKHSFTIYKTSSWCPTSINILTLLTDIAQEVKFDVEKIHLVKDGWDDTKKDHDQTRVGVECNIEIVLRKR